jgi:hypothetical protein
MLHTLIFSVCVICCLSGCSIYDHFLFWINLPWKVDVRLRIRNWLLGGHTNVHITDRKFLLGRRGTVLFLVCRAFELKASTYFLNVCVYSSIIVRSYRVWRKWCIVGLASLLKFLFFWMWHLYRCTRHAQTLFYCSSQYDLEVCLYSVSQSLPNPAFL